MKKRFKFVINGRSSKKCYIDATDIAEALTAFSIAYRLAASAIPVRKLTVTQTS